jgi:hypothetical protein
MSKFITVTYKRVMTSDHNLSDKARLILNGWLNIFDTVSHMDKRAKTTNDAFIS